MHIDDDTESEELVRNETSGLDDLGHDVDHDEESYEDEKPRKKSAVQQRIDELTARNSQLQRERDETFQEREELSRQLEEQRVRAAEYESVSGEHEARGKLAEVRAKIRKAVDEGNMDAEDKAREALLDIEAEIVRLRASRPKRPEKPDSSEKTEPSQQRPAQPQRYVSQKATAWAERNAAWMGKPEHASRTRMAHVIFGEMTATEGMSPDDDGTYAELDARLNRLYNTRPQRTARGPSGGDEGRTRQQQSKLTKEDRAMMKEMRLDPNNKTHAEEWIRQNRSAA